MIVIIGDDWTKELTLEMIPSGIYRQIAELIGVENLASLAKLIGGTTFYLPKLESFIKPVRDTHIKKEFTGYNHVELARKYDVTERWIRILCGEGSCEGQISIFDIGADEKTGEKDSRDCQKS